MTPAGAELRVYRLAAASRPARQVCEQAAVRAGHWHDVGDRVLYAYETEELAALSLSQRTHGAEPARLVHETLQLPDGPHLHAEFRVAGDASARRAFFAPGAAQLPYVNLCTQLRQRNLLSLWVTSPYATHRRTVLLNVAHAAFAEVRVYTHVLAGDAWTEPAPRDVAPTGSWARMRSEDAGWRTPSEVDASLGDSGLGSLGEWAEASARYDRPMLGAGLRAALRATRR